MMICASDIVKDVSVNVSGADKLYKGGKNLFNNDTSLIKQVSYTTSAGNSANKYGYVIDLPVGTYTINAISQVPSTDSHQYYIYSVVMDENNVAQTSTIRVVTANKPQSQTITIGKGQSIFIYDGETGGIAEARKAFSVFDIQIELGSRATEYEQYIEPTIYNVKADGTVAGVEASYPCTTLYTDTNGAMINATYYQDGKKVKEYLTDMILSLGGIINE